MDTRLFWVLIVASFIYNINSKEREELIPQKNKNTTCHCMAPQLCPRVLSRYTKYYLRTEGQNQKECPLYKEKCCEPTHIPVLKTLDNDNQPRR